MLNFLFTWIASTVLSALLAPRPKVQNAQPGQIGQQDIPMASMDAPIPVLFGSRVISQPNVVWWGDVRMVPIMSSGGGKK